MAIFIANLRFFFASSKLIHNFALNTTECVMSANKLIMRVIKQLFVSIFLFLTVVVSGQNFAFLTDLHVVPGNDNEISLRKIVSEINESDNKFVVVTGDLSNQGSDAELELVYGILAELKVPYHIISGNHETTWSESGCSTYNKYWKEDRFVFTDGQFLFIGFPCGPYMKMGDGFIKYEDILWVDKTLKEQLKPGMKLIVMAHYPLDESLSNYTAMLSVLAPYNPSVAFCGHGHDIRLLNYNSLTGLMGRAIASRDGLTKGYNEVSIVGDSLTLKDKVLGRAGVPKFTISLSGNDLSSIKTSPVQQPIVPTERQSKIFQDNASIFGGIAAAGDIVITANSLGVVKALDTKTNKQVWQAEFKGSLYFQPVVVGKVVVVGTSDGQLCGLQLKDGKQIWSVKSPRIFAGTGTIDGDNIYVASSTEFMKIKAVDGKVLWRAALPGSYSQGAPTIQGDKVLFGAWDTNLYCLDKNSGKLLWKWNNGTTNDLFSPGNVKMATTDRAVFLVAPDRYMTAIDIQTGKTLWRDNSCKVRESMGTSADGKAIYAKTMDGELLAVAANADRFEKLWLLNTGIGYEHNPCPILEYKGKIYMGSRKGEIIVVDAATHQMVSSDKIGYSSVNSFNVNSLTGELFCSLIEGGVYKIGK